MGISVKYQWKVLIVNDYYCIIVVGTTDTSAHACLVTGSLQKDVPGTEVCVWGRWRETV